MIFFPRQTFLIVIWPSNFIILRHRAPNLSFTKNKPKLYFDKIHFLAIVTETKTSFLQIIQTYSEFSSSSILCDETT